MQKIFLIIALVGTLTGALFSTKTLAVINKNMAAAKEAARPANVKIVKITTPNCQDCFNVDGAVLDFKKLNVKVAEEKSYVFDSPEAKAKISQLGIKKLPTYLVTGEVIKQTIADFVKTNGEIKDNTFIFTKLSPVFIDTTTGQEMGRVTATLITDSSCSQCPDLKLVIDNFQKAGVKIKDLKELSFNSLDGRRLINQYKITKIPTFIFSPEFDLYDAIKAAWANFGTVEEDKTYNSSGARISSSAYVARNIPLPYRDLAKGKIAGLVDLVYLTDSSCADCYKVQDVQRPILTQGYGVALRSEQTVDAASAEGKKLISRYTITKIPTILLSPEADQYSNIKDIWQSVGTVAADGWYVFTGLSQLGNITYKDLIENQVVKPAEQTKK